MVGRIVILVAVALLGSALPPALLAGEASGPAILSRSPSGLPLLRLSLDDSTQLVIGNSHNLAAAAESALSATDAAASAKAKIYPHLSFQGQNKEVSKVGQVTVPGVGNVQAGDHENWSVGAVLDWVAWDAGQLAKQAKSLRFTASSQEFSTAALERSVRYQGRMAYFDVQLAGEQLKLVADALALARAQYAVVTERARVGNLNRLDLVVAHEEVMTREKEYEDAGRELAVQVRSLFALLGADQIAEPTFPADVRQASSLRAVPIAPDMLIDLEPIAASLVAMMPRAEGAVVIKRHPAFRAAEEGTNSARLAYDAARAGHWPKLTLQGRSSYDYPNFAQQERIQQNTLLLNLQLPVIDWGMISKQAASEKHKQLAAAEQTKQAGIELSRDLSQAKDQIAVLKRSRTTAAARERDAREAASLVYDEYLAGHVIFLEVQRANHLALWASVERARTNVQLLGQLARMESLITEEADAP